MSILYKLGAAGVGATIVLTGGPGLAQSLPVSEVELIAQSREDDEDDRIKYFGAGATIGISDGADTALGEGGFSLVGRYSFTDTLSVHTASVFDDDNVVSAALTTGWPIKNQSDETVIFPFVGAGVAVEIDDFEVNPLVSTGVDVPITDLVTGTARINASFDSGTDIGLVLGVGVDFLELF